MEWGFWIWEAPEGNLKLISLEHEPDDPYTENAPTINIIFDN